MSEPKKVEAVVKPTNKKKIWLCIIGSILIALYCMPSCSSSHSKSVTINIPIYTDRLSVIETGGRKFHNLHVITNGVSLRYTMYINDTRIPIILPKSVENKCGDERKIHTVYFKLEEGQDHDWAIVPFIFDSD